MASEADHLLVLSIVMTVAAALLLGADGQLSPTFYATSCPTLQTIVRSGMDTAVAMDPRMAASMLRLHFHDCFVQGCDASILLDDTATLTGEKGAGPNVNSVRGYEVIDAIKAAVEASCNRTVSCADILALAARDGVVIQGGQSWTVPLGRRDSLTALPESANSDLPGPGSSLQTLINMFSNKGLTAAEMTTLSGGHTIGLSKCTNARSHLYNDTNIDSAFATQQQANCPFSSGNENLLNLDSTPTQFDNTYFTNLVAKRAILHSDQELFNNGTQDSLVRTYSQNQATFFSDFAAAMIKLSSITPLTGTDGEIRTNCRAVNS